MDALDKVTYLQDGEYFGELGTEVLSVINAHVRIVKID